MPPKLISRNLITDLFGGDPNPIDRTPGKHVSGAIHEVMKAIHPDRFSDRGDTFVPTVQMLLGQAVEHAIAAALARQFPNRFVQPGELCLDDITGTPDLWDLEKWATVEIKLTWASSRRAEDIEDIWFWRYWEQGKTYAFMAGQRTVILIIFFVNGNYIRNDDDPDKEETIGMMWEWEFDEAELAETWEMVKANAGAAPEKKRGSDAKKDNVTRTEAKRSSDLREVRRSDDRYRERVRGSRSVRPPIFRKHRKKSRP